MTSDEEDQGMVRKKKKSPQKPNKMKKKKKADVIEFDESDQALTKKPKPQIQEGGEESPTQPLKTFVKKR